MKVTLKKITIENLRNFYDTDLPLDMPKMLIVGPNNAGKTSLLKLLDWTLNRVSPDTFDKVYIVDPSDEVLSMLPARSRTHRARRLTLILNIPDGRSRRRFNCDENGNIALRINFRLHPSPRAFLKAGAIQRGESANSDPVAIELLKALQGSVSFIHIPANRNASSATFDSMLMSAIRDETAPHITHQTRGVAPREYQTLSSAFQDTKSTVLDLLRPLEKEFKDSVPPSFIDNAAFSLTCDLVEMCTFFESHLELKITTGDHDSDRVKLNELGSGLQSLLYLALQDVFRDTKKHTILAIEEPEAFLHPSSQRSIANRLMKSSSTNQLIITTHSSLFVDEAEFNEIVILKDSKFFYPNYSVDEDRNEINTLLTTDYRAEAMFAKSLLLVEGPGDRAFFEQLRRRIAEKDNSGRIDDCFVIDAGSNNRFAPWIKLLESYKKRGVRPIEWIIAPDGDSFKKIREGFKNAKYTIPRSVSAAISHASQVAEGDMEQLLDKIKELNELTSKENFPLYVLPIDLEQVICENMSQKTYEKIAEKISKDNIKTLEDLMNCLGSKRHSPSSNPKKSPYVRGYIGRMLPSTEISESARELLLRWIAPVLGDAEAKNLLNEL